MSIALIAAAFDACRPVPHSEPSSAMHFDFPEDAGNFRVTGVKRIDVVFPLASATHTVCKYNQIGPASVTRSRQLSWYITHRYPADYMSIGAHDVVALVQLPIDSVTIPMDRALAFEKKLSLAMDSTFGAPLSVVLPTEAFVRAALNSVSVSLVTRQGEPPLEFGRIAVKPGEIALREGRLSFSINDSAAVRMLMAPDNVSVTMSWCGDGKNRPGSQVTIERRK